MRRHDYRNIRLLFLPVSLMVEPSQFFLPLSCVPLMLLHHCLSKVVIGSLEKLGFSHVAIWLRSVFTVT